MTGLFLKIMIVLAAAASTTAAQSTFGVMRGRVLDPTGVGIPAVSVTVTNTATNIGKAVNSNEAGFYEAGYLQPGTYSVSAAHSGFKAYTAQNIILNASAIVLADIRMELGEVSSSVTVEGGAPLITTESAVISDVKTQKQYLETALNQRGNWDSYVFNFMSLVPGAQPGSNTWLIMFGGTRYSSNDFTVDGITTPGVFGLLGPAFPSMESIQEVKADYSGNSAEYRAAGHVSVISKRGQNTLRGSAYWYHISGGLGARNFFASTTPFAVLNDFGATVSGPVVKNKTFYSGTFEGFNQRTAALLNLNLASNRMLAGDFSNLRDARGNLIAINDPRTGRPFPGNVIPSDRLNATALKFQQRFFPKPNFGDPDSIVGNYRDLIKQWQRREQVDVRVDHQFSTFNSIFARVTAVRMPLQTVEGNLPAMGFRFQRRQDRNMVVSDTHTFRPTLINEFRFGISRDYNPRGITIDGPALVRELGLTNLPANLPEFPSTPQVSITGFQGISHLAYNTPAAMTYQWQDNLSWIRGQHTFKMGTEVRHYYTANYGTSPSSAYGNISFTGQFTGNGYADFLLGIPRTASRASSGFVRDHMTNTMLSFFFQDDYKITPRLSLNAGIRYERLGPISEQEDRLQAFDPILGKLVVPTEASRAQLNSAFVASNLIPIVTAEQAGLPRQLLFTDGNNFAPRVGLAYKLTSDNKTSLRAAYGIFYDLYVAQPRGGPYGGSENAPPNTITNGVPLWELPAMFPSQAAAVGTASLVGVNPHLRVPYLQQWNFSLERELWHMGLRASYMGIKTTNLVYTRNVNQVIPSMAPFSVSRRPYPQLGTVSYSENGGSAIYHALVLSAERKHKSGLMYQVTHTWAKNLDDADKGDGSVGTPENSYDRRRERGDNSYTRRHRFVFSSIYELPFDGAGQVRWLRQLMRGWSMSAMGVFQTGQYFTPSFSGFDPSNTGTSGGRPDRIANGNLEKPTIDRWFDTSAFVVPPAGSGRFGNSGVNILRGPGTTLLNLGIFKRFFVSESIRFQIEGTFTNALNHPNFSTPGSNITTASAGVVRSTQSLEGAGSRTTRLGMRLDF